MKASNCFSSDDRFHPAAVQAESAKFAAFGNTTSLEVENAEKEPILAFGPWIVGSIAQNLVSWLKSDPLDILPLETVNSLPKRLLVYVDIITPILFVV